ncbi:hypothetical protein PIB30_026361 [Stylosanthes scabra]|uniref:Uncharacterized protein n=1 Tax=Stylosanthes scabra TaxID=79078 RepID=A0ABU6ZAQ6_9FABA|nr:hypothetical protein [Stylosanthes scabra]
MDIDMDMDMDIPLPEELELLELESNSHLYHEPQDLQSDYPDFDLPEPEPEQEPKSQLQTQPQPESPDLVVLPEPHSNGHKRSRSSGASPDRSISEEKRVRVGDSAASDVDAVSNDDDEDWLRYSPPPRGEEEVMFVKEKELSRYASEIDGECMPVTAPGGDRVYAKLNRIERVERARKLDWRANSAGKSVTDEGFSLDLD